MNASLNRQSITVSIAFWLLVAYGVVFLVGGVGPYLA